MTEPDYYFATNKAYDLLNKYQDYSYPTPIFSIIRDFDDIKLLSYSEAAKIFNTTFEEFYSIASSQYGFSIKNFSAHQTLILYNDKKDETVIRFTLAHELGHYILFHTKDSENEDKEANCFARNILCPIPVIYELGLTHIHEYVNTFYVSEPMAQVSIDKKLCDYGNITKDNYSMLNDRIMCFYNGITINELYGYNDQQYYA